MTHTKTGLYVVDMPFVLFAHVANIASKTYFGSAMTVGRLYHRVETKPGDKVYVSDYGTFLFHDGKWREAKTRVSPKAAFSRDYEKDPSIPVERMHASPAALPAPLRLAELDIEKYDGPRHGQSNDAIVDMASTRTRGAAAGRAAGPAGQNIPIVYHATLATYLPSIAEHGLVPSTGRGGGVGKGAYGSWSQNKVFVSGPSDAFYWFGRVEEHGEAGSDDVRRDAAIPVMLRMRDLRRLLQADTVAKSEGQDDSYYVRRRIPPNQIEVFNGLKWVPVDRFGDSDDVEEFARKHTSCERDEPEEERDEDEDDGEEHCDYTSLIDVVRGGDSMRSTMPPEIYPSIGSASGRTRTRTRTPRKQKKGSRR